MGSIQEMVVPHSSRLLDIDVSDRAKEATLVRLVLGFSLQESRSRDKENTFAPLYIAMLVLNGFEVSSKIIGIRNMDDKKNNAVVIWALCTPLGQIFGSANKLGGWEAIISQFNQQRFSQDQLPSFAQWRPVDEDVICRLRPGPLFDGKHLPTILHRIGAHLQAHFLQSETISCALLQVGAHARL